jgi:hypothetical protein
MTDPGKEREGGQLTTPPAPPDQAARREHGSRTEGTNRDYDESQRSANQGHGHPREERGEQG